MRWWCGWRLSEINCTAGVCVRVLAYTPYSTLSNLFSIVNGWLTARAAAAHSETVTNAMTLFVPLFLTSPACRSQSGITTSFGFLQGKWTTILTLSFKRVSGLNNPRKSSGSQQTEPVLFYSCDDVMMSEERKWLPSKREDSALPLLTGRLIGVHTSFS